MIEGRAQDGRGMKAGGRARKYVLRLLVLAAALCIAGGCVRKARSRLDGVRPASSKIVSVNRTVLDVPVPEAFASSSGHGQNGMTHPGDMLLESAPDMPFSSGLSWLPRKESASVREYSLELSKEPQASGIFTRRARSLLPVVVEILVQRELPLELAFLPVVESRFEPQALSPAGAAGVWQLMPCTARRFGLVVSRSMDERFDVRKATAAAASYLASLHRRFQNWPLAVAAYNCGEGALIRALERTGATTLAELMEACRRGGAHSGLLSRETLDFVPKFIGAVWAMTAAPMASDSGVFRKFFPDGTVFFRDHGHWPGAGQSAVGGDSGRRVAMVP